MNTTLPTMSLGLLGGSFSDPTGAVAAEPHDAGFDDTLKSVLDDAGGRDAADARDDADARDAGPAVAYAPPAHLLATLVNAAPIEPREPARSVEEHDAPAGVGFGSGSGDLGKAIFTGDSAVAGSSVSATVTDSPSTATAGSVDVVDAHGPTASAAPGVARAPRVGSTAPAPVAVSGARDASTRSVATAPAAGTDVDAALFPRDSRGATPTARTEDSRTGTTSSVANDAAPIAVNGVDAAAIGAADVTTTAIGSVPASVGPSAGASTDVASFDWQGADFGPSGFVAAGPAVPPRTAIASRPLTADGFAQNSPAVSSAALANALGDGSFGTHIIETTDPTPTPAESPVPVPMAAPEASPIATTPAISNGPAAKPVVATKTAKAPATATAGVRPTTSSAKSAKSASARLGEANDAENTDKTDAPALENDGPPRQNAPASPNLVPDAPTPPHAPKAHDVKTVTAPNLPPTAPADSAQEAVRVAESLGHKRVLASGEARGHITIPELGRIEVRAHTDAASAIQVNVQVDDAQARAVVQQHAPELRAHVHADVPNANIQLDQRNAGNTANHGQSEHRGGSGDQGRHPSDQNDDGAQGNVETAVHRQIRGARGQARYVL